MSKYPLIESLGLKHYSIQTYSFGIITEPKYSICSDFILASELEKALQDAPIVVKSDYSMDWVDGTEILGGKTGRENIATKTARLVCIQPIKKKTKAEAAIELLEEMARAESIRIDFGYKNSIKEILEMPE